MTSPWPATAAHRPRESTSRCTRAASSLCRCAASRPPPRGERRRRGETERSQCERARARACLLTAGVQGRCAAGASSLHWYTAALTQEPDHPRRRSRSQSRSPSPSPGPDPSQVRAARLPARITREERGKGLQRVVDLAAFLGTPARREGGAAPARRGRPGVTRPRRPARAARPPRAGDRRRLVAVCGRRANVRPACVSSPELLGGALCHPRPLAHRSGGARCRHSSVPALISV